MDEASRKLANSQGIDCDAFTSDRPPQRLFSRVQWYADATLNQARHWLSRKSKSIPTTEGPGSLKLEDFHWPWAIRRFREVVQQYKPNTIIFEYIKMGYLMDALSEQQRRQINCVVDTHDILYRRAEQFFAHGFPHWLTIDRSEEAESLKQFDLIMAIQEHEAEEFREMAPATETIRVGHAVELTGNLKQPPQQFKETPIEQLRIGYIGSKNFSNWSAIRKFLRTAWPKVLQKNNDFCQLLIAGGICDWIQGQPDLADPDPGILTPEQLQSVQLLGHVGAIEQWYDQIDVLINPVEFGTGLKIKNAEALSFGKLLITTTQGFDGMPQSTRLACKVVNSVDEMGDAINSLTQEADSIRSMQSLAAQLAQTEFSPKFAYSELSEWIDRSNRNRLAKFTAEQ